MRLAGPGVWEPPRNRGEATTVLREAVERGITQFDTSDYCGPHTVNELIREALHPYPKDLHIVTKVGARRAPDKSWRVALSREELTGAVHDNLSTSSVAHLRENIAATNIKLPADAVDELDRIGAR
jgi:pyridoxine 4-dehydrogenase